VNGAFTTLSAGSLTGDTSAATSTATGSTTARTDAARFAERINVRDYGAVGDNVTDDRNAFAAAIARVNTLNAVGTTPNILYIPPGEYRIKGTNGALPQFTTRTSGGVLGDGEYKSWVIMDSTYTGDLFSWSEAWGDGSTGAPNTLNVNTSFTGPTVKNIGIVGNRTAVAAQYALHFYDRTDEPVLENVSMLFVKGGCISFGTPKNVPGNGFVREGVLNNIHCASSGDTTIPAIEFHSVGAIGGNPMNMQAINIYGPHGPGLVIRNDATTGISNYKIVGLRIEGTEGNPDSVLADLMTIGSTTSIGGAIHDIDISQMQLSNPYTGFCAFRMTSQDAPSKPFGIVVSGGIFGPGPGVGKGLCIDAGRQSSFHLQTNTTADTNVTIGPAGMVDTGITIDGNGQEWGWTWVVDGTSTRLPQSLFYKNGVSTLGTLSATVAPGTGVVTGANSFDGQLTRGNTSQTASASGAVAFGSSNTAAGLSATVSGGTLNALSGQFSVSPGGKSSADRGRTGILVMANGQIGASGDSQWSNAVMFGSGSTAAAFRLTSGGAAAGATNCLDIPNNTAFGFGVRLHARNFTTPGQDYDWYVPNNMMVRDTGVASTAVTLGTPIILTRGTVTGAAVAATADITNGCLSLTFAPPTANTTDVWHASARIDSIEVQ
jgi:hypothetical protein